MKRILVTLFVVGGLMAFAAGAQANSSCSGYNVSALCSGTQTNNATGTGTNGAGTNVNNNSGHATEVSNESPAGAATNSAGSLPFTGLDVVLLLVGGGTLLGAGLLVRVLSRRLDES